MTAVEQIYRDIEITFEIHDPVRMYFESRRGEWLEREKQQIIDAYTNGFSDGIDDGKYDLDPKYQSAEQYFNNTFNK